MPARRDLVALDTGASALESGIPFPQVQTECQWFDVLGSRSEQRSVLSASLLENRWLIGGLVAGNVLHAIGIVATLILWVGEPSKLFMRRRDA